MVWNILFFVLGVFGGVTLMALMQASDMSNGYDKLSEIEEVITYKDMINEMTLNEKKDYKITFDDKIWWVDLERNCSRRFMVFTEDGLKTVEIDYKILEEPWEPIDISTPYENNKHIPRLD